MEIDRMNNKLINLDIRINKKEDDLKNLINEKDFIINEINNKLVYQENIIKNNKKEITMLNTKLEKLIEEFNDFKMKIIENTNNKLNTEVIKVKKENENNLNNLKTEVLNNINKIENKLQEKDAKDKEYNKKLKRQLKPLVTGLKIINIKDEYILPCYKYPSREIRGKRYYTLLVMGEIGVGKTTLLDAFVNYLTGMNIEDQWRYKLSEEDNINVYCNSSQTREIKSYFINNDNDDINLKENINIKIIDTPGFGNILEDNSMVKKFKDFFKKIKELDYILVTFKSPETLFTLSNEYTLERIQEIFGKDVLGRIVLICTFDDGGEPIVIKNLENRLNYEAFFCFNSKRVLCDLREYEKDEIKYFWKKGMSNFERLLDFIIKKNLNPLNLNMSIKVMEIREEINFIANNSKNIIKETFEIFKKLNILLTKNRNISNYDNILDEEITKLLTLGNSIKKNIESIKNLLNELDKMALEPRAVLKEEYFSDYFEKDENFNKELKLMKEKVKIINDLSRVEKVTDLFTEYTDIINELKMRRPNRINSSWLII